jgi:sarcosine oxidase/L-pipecolate oxidase
MATGGSLHAWKFLPLLGEFVVDSMEGKLSENIRHKWSWESKSEKKPNELCFMEEAALQEFQQVTGSRVRL